MTEPQKRELGTALLAAWRESSDSYYALSDQLRARKVSVEAQRRALELVLGGKFSGRQWGLSAEAGTARGNFNWGGTTEHIGKTERKLPLLQPYLIPQTGGNFDPRARLRSNLLYQRWLAVQPNFTLKEWEAIASRYRAALDWNNHYADVNGYGPYYGDSLYEGYVEWRTKRPPTRRGMFAAKRSPDR